jgi:hypothetical protein
MRALYQEVAFARSLLANELPDGRLKLIDGHLRRNLDPDMEVEVLDVNEEEARALLLSIDPLVALAETQQQLHARLLELTPTAAEELRAAWEATAQSLLEVPVPPQKMQGIAEPFLLLITCRGQVRRGQQFRLGALIQMRHASRRDRIAHGNLLPLR